MDPIYHSQYHLQVNYYTKQNVLLCVVLPGHAVVPQPCSSVEIPRQLVPPPEGGGLLHKRCLVRTPPPQDAEHELQLDHEPQLPSTRHHINSSDVHGY